MREASSWALLSPAQHMPLTHLSPSFWFSANRRPTQRVKHPLSACFSWIRRRAHRLDTGVPRGPAATSWWRLSSFMHLSHRCTRRTRPGLPTPNGSLAVCKSLAVSAFRSSEARQASHNSAISSGCNARCAWLRTLDRRSRTFSRIRPWSQSRNSWRCSVRRRSASEIRLAHLDLVSFTRGGQQAVFVSAEVLESRQRSLTAVSRTFSNSQG